MTLVSVVVVSRHGVIKSPRTGVHTQFVRSHMHRENSGTRIPQNRPQNRMQANPEINKEPLPLFDWPTGTGETEAHVHRPPPQAGGAQGGHPPAGRAHRGTTASDRRDNTICTQVGPATLRCRCWPRQRSERPVPVSQPRAPPPQPSVLYSLFVLSVSSSPHVLLFQLTATSRP